MVFNWNSEIIRDTRNKKIFHIKNSDKYFLIDEEKEKLTDVFNSIHINAFSISAVVGYILKFEYWIWIVFAAVLYLAYVVYFNYKVLPEFIPIKQKQVVVKEKKSSKFRVIASSIGLIVVGLGLALCVYFEQVTGILNIIFILGCSIFALVVGSVSAYKNTKKKQKGLLVG